MSKHFLSYPFSFCSYCRWNSAKVDITFEKPPPFGAQLQKFEDSAPVSLEFERLKERFEPFLLNPITAAAPSALACDTLGVGKYALAPHDRRDKGVQDEIHGYHSRVKVGGTKEGANVDFMQRLEEVLQVAALSQRWANSWTIDSALECN